MGRPPALGGASVRIPAQPVQVINAPGVFAAWAHGGLLQMHQPKTFRDGPAGWSVHGNLKAGRWSERSHAPGWLINRICAKPSCPNSSMSPLLWDPQL